MNVRRTVSLWGVLGVGLANLAWSQSGAAQPLSTGPKSRECSFGAAGGLGGWTIHDPLFWLGVERVPGVWHQWAFDFDAEAGLQVFHDAFLDYVDRWMFEDDAAFVRTIKEATGRDHDKEWARQGQAWDAFVNEMWARHRPTLGAPVDGWSQPHEDTRYRFAVEHVQ